MANGITRVTIRELEEGWEAQGRHYKTATHALRAVKRASKKRAGSDGIDVTMITWEPCTQIGKLVAQVLASV